MLKFLRRINRGWLLILVGVVSLSAGLSMQQRMPDGDTWLCVDAGCVYVQSWSAICLAVLTLGVGAYLLLR